MARTLETTACIAGGGPAGMMLGYLLARAGIDTVVLEKHADFLRDFRGDTVHPSTMAVLKELGLLDEFLKRPHQKVTRVTAVLGDEEVTLGNFARVRAACPYIAFMPQWDFLDFLADAAKEFPSFRLMMNAEVEDLVFEGERVAGVKVKTDDGPLTVRAKVTFGTDGRHSLVRAKAGLKVKELGAPIDVLWMRLPREASDPTEPFARIDGGHFFIMLYRGDYWQCAWVIPKGSFDAIKAAGLDAFRAGVADAAPLVASRVGALKSWDDIKLLTVRVDRLEEWARAGLLCIGDAAHAMSPVGGVGINLAIQDAVAAANLLYRPLRDGTIDTGDLQKVQARREWPAKATQRLQIAMQNAVIGPALAGERAPRPPRLLRLLTGVPWLRRLPARLLGLGLRPEHVSEALRHPTDREN